MRVVPIAAALWATHALAASPTTDVPAMALSPALVPAQRAAAAPAAPANTYASESGGAPFLAAPAGEEPLHWGVMIDAGIPDVLGASAIFRPMTWLRIAAGGTYNFVSGGIRVGASLVPLYTPIAPSLNVDVGHYFAGDVRPILQQAIPSDSGVELPDNRLLREVGYDYASAQLGLEFGVPKTFAIFLRAGATYIQADLRGFQEIVQEAAGGTGAPDTTYTAADLKIRLVAPTLKLGVIVYF